MRTDSSFEIRLARESDIDTLHDIECDAWGEGAASQATLLFRVSAPHWDTVIVSRPGSQIDLAFAQVVWIDPEQISGQWSWKSVVGIGESSTRDIAYGVNLSARRSAVGMGRMALQAALGLVVHRAGSHFLAGGRLPGYATWSDRISADMYVSLYHHEGELYSVRGREVLVVDNDGNLTPSTVCSDIVRRSGRAVDPFVRMILDTRLLGRPCEILGTMPDYFDDASSRNWGLLYCWRNPFVTPEQTTLAALAMRMNASQSIS